MSLQKLGDLYSSIVKKLLEKFKNAFGNMRNQDAKINGSNFEAEAEKMGKWDEK